MKIDELLKERGDVHGDFGQGSAWTQSLKSVMRHSPNWEDLPPFMKQALEAIQDKISRILVGDPTHLDHWVDISGYSTLVVNALRKFEVEQQASDADLHNAVARDLGVGGYTEDGMYVHTQPRYSYEDSVAQCDGFPRYNRDGTENEEWKILQAIDQAIDTIDSILGAREQE